VPLFRLRRISEDLFSDNALCRFVQILIQCVLDLEKLRPEGAVDERRRSAQYDCGMPLAWIPVRLESVTSAERDKEAPIPEIREAKIHFDRLFGLPRSTERGTNPIDGGRCRISFSRSRGTFKKGRNLAQFLTKFLFSGQPVNGSFLESSRSKVLVTTLF
jgi:hypothetical protein